jgi:hypothetical protein
MQKLQLGLSGQKMLMDTTKDDLGALQKLSAEEMKDKRAAARDATKEAIAASREKAKGDAEAAKPSSPAGKQALDEGLTLGSPEYKARVKEIADTTLDKTTATAQAALANVTNAQTRLALDQNKFEQAKAQGAKLTPAEMHLKANTEDAVAAQQAALVNLQKAYKLNPGTFDTSLIDTAQRKLLEATGSKDPKVLATREMENLLSQKALDTLKSTFGGNPTEGERAILLSLQGLGAKSKEERAAIMQNAYGALKVSAARNKQRLKDINAGAYRNTTPDAAPADDIGGLQ